MKYKERKRGRYREEKERGREGEGSLAEMSMESPLYRTYRCLGGELRVDFVTIKNESLDMHFP